MNTNSIKVLRRIFIAVSLLILSFNSIAVYKAYRVTLSEMQSKRPPEPGEEFKELKDFLRNVKKTGFLTDKDMSPEKNDGQFLGAQYILVPTILSLNDASPEFIILDYQSLLAAYQKIKEMNAVIVMTTPYGKILVRKP